MNQVHLIGVLASMPRARADADSVGFRLLITERVDGAGVDRHRLLVDRRSDSEEWELGDTVYVHGEVRCRAGRCVVVVVGGFRIAPSMPPPRRTLAELGGTHRTPVGHERRGHLRRVAAGSDRERLVWVRPTTVHGRSEEGPHVAIAHGCARSALVPPLRPRQLRAADDG